MKRAAPFDPTRRQRNFRHSSQSSAGVTTHRAIHISLNVEFATFIDPEEFSEDDFDEDQQLHWIPPLCLTSLRDLQNKRVEDLKLRAQEWLWDPLHLAVPTSDYVLLLSISNSSDPHRNHRKMVLDYKDTWSQVLNKWRISPCVKSLMIEVWAKDLVPVPVPNIPAWIDLPLSERRSAAAYLRRSQEEELANQIPR